MNILNIKSVKEKINLVKNYFSKFSIKQKIIGISTILIALVISAFFIFFYESEEDKMKTVLEKELTNYMYEDFELHKILKDKLVNKNGILSNKNLYDVSEFYKEICDTIKKNKKIKIFLSKRGSNFYNYSAKLISFKKGEAGTLVFEMTVNGELIGHSGDFSTKYKETHREVYLEKNNGDRVDKNSYKNMGEASRDCWNIVDYEKDGTNHLSLIDDITFKIKPILTTISNSRLSSMLPVEAELRATRLRVYGSKSDLLQAEAEVRRHKREMEIYENVFTAKEKICRFLIDGALELGVNRANVNHIIEAVKMGRTLQEMRAIGYVFDEIKGWEGLYYKK